MVIAMIETAARWIRDKYEAIRSAASSSKPVVPDTVDEAGAARRKFADAIGSFSDFFENSVSKLEENTYLRQFLVNGESFRKSGYIAGLWGIREDDIDGIAAMQIRMTTSLIEERYQSNQRKLESQVDILRTIRANAERDYETKNAYYEKLKRAYQYSHRQFSLTLGFIYGFFAVVLVLADIPLALELTKRGFNLKSDPESAISDLFAYGTQEGFVLHFLKVLTVNWEVVLFATGIAFCTIYIKIFYDDFIGVPLENLIKKASESPRADYEEVYLVKTERSSEDRAANEEDQALAKKKISDRFNRLWWWRFLVKLTVLLVLFSTILVLGYFRYSVVTAPSIKDIAPPVIFLTYSLLTLIFPIISGICGSLSLSNFHNWSEIGKAKKENSEAQKTVLKATDEFRVKEEEKERNKSFLGWLAKEETMGQLKEFLIYCYQSGYKFGYQYPEWTFGGDLFTRAEALRNRNFTGPDRSIDVSSSVTPVTIAPSALN